jgi:hypothetical protein
MTQMISLGSKLALVSIAICVAFLGCGKSGDNDANVAGDSAGAGKAGEPSGVTPLEIGGSGNVEVLVPSAGAGGLPAQPVVACGQAGGDSAGAGGMNEECAAPPSACADNQRLVYSSGVCVAGACTWTVETLFCPGACYNGACGDSFTAR